MTPTAHEWFKRIATAYDEASDQATGAWDVWALARDIDTSGLAVSEIAGLRFTCSSLIMNAGADITGCSAADIGAWSHSPLVPTTRHRSSPTQTRRARSSEASPLSAARRISKMQWAYNTDCVPSTGSNQASLISDASYGSEYGE